MLLSLISNSLLIMLLSGLMSCSGETASAGPSGDVATGEVQQTSPSNKDGGDVLTKAEFDLIQRFYNARADYASLKKLDSGYDIESVENQSGKRGAEENTGNMQEPGQLENTRQEFFAKYGFTEKEFFTRIGVREQLFLILEKIIL